MKTLDDDAIADLLMATAAGRRDAFRKLYDMTAPKLLGVILRMRHDRAAAEDILQDVYLRIWRNASQFRREAGPAMAWLVSIARYRAIDLMRQRQPVPVAAGEDGVDPLERVADETDAAGRFVEGQALQYCLERVEPSHRECLVLAYCEGWSREELGVKYGRPANTIKTWLHRGLAALRQCLDET